MRACHRKVNCIEDQVLHNSKICLPRRLVHNSCAGVHTSEHSYKLAEHKPLQCTSSWILLAKLRIVTDPSLCLVVCKSFSRQAPIVADYIIDSSLTVELIVSSMCSSRTRGRAAAAAATAGTEREDIYVNSEHETNRRFYWTAVATTGSRAYTFLRIRIYTCDRSYAINGEPRNRRCVCFMHE